MNDFPKRLMAIALAGLATATAVDAGAIQRAGVKVAGESVWIPGIQVRTADGDIFSITTERYVKGRSLEGAAQVFPDSAFEVYDYKSAAQFVRREFDTAFLEDKPSSDKNGSTYEIDKGPDGMLGTADDIAERKTDASKDSGW
ncbi:MAG: hypothetical protein AAF982_02970 [Pseudomonadota bacterium]